MNTIWVLSYVSLNPSLIVYYTFVALKKLFKLPKPKFCIYEVEIILVPISYDNISKAQFMAYVNIQ